MANLIIIDPKIIPQNTIISGNTDVDKYIIDISYVQDKVVREMLGDELYNKIEQDYETNSLSGLYLELYNNYLVYIIKYYTVAEHISLSNISVDNSGIQKYSPDKKTAVTPAEVQVARQKYSSLAQVYVDRFNKWICENKLTEYHYNNDIVNPNEDIDLGMGWHL